MKVTKMGRPKVAEKKVRTSFTVLPSKLKRLSNMAKIAKVSKSSLVDKALDLLLGA